MLFEFLQHPVVTPWASRGAASLAAETMEQTFKRSSLSLARAGCRVVDTPAQSLHGGSGSPSAEEVAKLIFKRSYKTAPAFSSHVSLLRDWQWRQPHFHQERLVVVICPHCKGTHPSTGDMAEQRASAQGVTSSRMSVTLVMEGYCSLSLFPNNFNIQGDT